MRRNRMVLSVGLIIFVCMAWAMQIKGLITENHTYQEDLKAAVYYQEKGLYQKAIILYEGLFTIKEDTDVRLQWMDANRKGYKEGVIPESQYEAALLQMCEIYPEDPVYWEEAISHYISTGSYNSARGLYKKCIEVNVSSESLTDLLRDVRYALKIKSKTYTEFSRSPNGYYTLNDGNKWTGLDPYGGTTVSNYYKYISPYNADLDVLVVSETKRNLYGGAGIVEAIITREVVQTGAYGDGVIPFKEAHERWRFLNCGTNEFQGDIYSAVSNYQDGIAVVSKDGTWNLVDTAMQPVGEYQFDDIKLYGNLDYSYDKIMIASVDGVYGIYDQEGNKKNEFACQNADIFLNGYIAYSDSTGKWGYVDEEGTVVIEPRFENAKSFSNDLAAVQLDGKWGFINTRGDVVIDCQFLDADYFTRGGMCLVSLEEGLYHVAQLRYLE